MEFFNSAVDTLQTIVVGLGGALCVWGGINLLEGYGQDRRVHETPSGNQTDFFYCNQSRNGLTLSTFRDSTLKNMPAG